MAKQTATPPASSSELPARDWIVDAELHPDRVIEHHRLTNLNNPEVHAAFARQVRDKAAAEGIIHVDRNTGYRARFFPGNPPKDNAA